MNWAQKSAFLLLLILASATGCMRSRGGGGGDGDGDGDGDRERDTQSVDGRGAGGAGDGDGDGDGDDDTVDIGDCSAEFEELAVSFCSAQDFEGTFSFGGTNVAECIGRVDDAAQGACSSGCEERLATWLECLDGATPIYSYEAASEACGVEEGLLSNCCSVCPRYVTQR